MDETHAREDRPSTWDETWLEPDVRAPWLFTLTQVVRTHPSGNIVVDSQRDGTPAKNALRRERSVAQTS